MLSLKAFIASAKAGAKRLMQNVAEATAPQKNPLRINPMVAFAPHRNPRFTGLQLAWIKTRKSSRISYRAGRSKYDSPEFKLACAAARLRAAV